MTRPEANRFDLASHGPQALNALSATVAAWHHPSVLITGYENHPLVDGSALLTDPALWAVHAQMVGVLGPVDLQRDYGVDTEDAEELCEQLFDPDHWPVFTVPLRSGAALHVVYRNLADDMGVDYLLAHPDWPRGLQLAAVEGSFVGPGLSWHELITIAHQPPKSSPAGTRDPDRRVLLLLPALGDADLPDDAVPALTAALTRTTAGPVPRHVAETLLRDERAYWQPAHWTQQANGALVCDEHHSRRCPQHPNAFTPAQALAITQALNAP